jgi:hypothetical protein
VKSGRVIGLDDRHGAVLTGPPGQPARCQAAALMAEIKDNRPDDGAVRRTE